MHSGKAGKKKRRTAAGKKTEELTTGAAWCYAVEPYDGERIPVQDEDGNVSSYSPKYGGELLFGKNGKINAGDVVGRVNFIGTHDVYEYLKAKKEQGGKIEQDRL